MKDNIIVENFMLFQFEEKYFQVNINIWIAPWNNDLCYIFRKWVFLQNGILAAVRKQPWGF